MTTRKATGAIATVPRSKTDYGRPSFTPFLADWHWRGSQPEGGLLFPMSLTLDNHHVYRWNGNRVLGVTQILDAVLPNPYQAARASDVEFKRQVGDAVHAATHYADENDLDLSTVNPVVLPYIEAYLRFCLETGFSPKCREIKVYSALYKFAGTIDRVGRINCKRTGLAVVDLKCTATINIERVRLQTMAYKIAAEEQLSVRIDHRICVQLKPDGSYQARWLDNHAADKTAFIHALGLAAWRTSNSYTKPDAETEESDALCADQHR